jgi:hypothetical protein
MSFEGQVVQSPALCPASLSIKGLKYLASRVFTTYPLHASQAILRRIMTLSTEKVLEAWILSPEDCYLLLKHVDCPHLDFRYDLLPSHRWESLSI